MKREHAVNVKTWCVSPSGVQTLADTRGQYSASVSPQVVCEVGDRRWFGGDPRPGFYLKMVDDESERGGRVGLLLLSKQTRNNSPVPQNIRQTPDPEYSVLCGGTISRTKLSGYSA